MLTGRPASAGMPGVPKYDAFGREIGEDTLAGLGGTPRPSAEPADEGWHDTTVAPEPRDTPEAPEADRPVIAIGDPPPQAAPRIPGSPPAARAGRAGSAASSASSSSPSSSAGRSSAWSASWTTRATCSTT